MEDQMREPGQLIFLFGDESVHRRGRVAQRAQVPSVTSGVSTAR